MASGPLVELLPRPANREVDLLRRDKAQTFQGQIFNLPRNTPRNTRNAPSLLELLKN